MEKPETKKTPLDWFYENIKSHFVRDGDLFETFTFSYSIAKIKERNDKLKHQLFIGKVCDIIGYEKTVELLKECNEALIINK